MAVELFPLVVSLALVSGSWAQSNAVCLPFYSWTFNSAKQSPCTVASDLIAVCNAGPFPVLALPDSSHYIGPSLANASPCQCNTVTYSLMSACGACQGKTYLSWSVWATNCATVFLGTYPEPIPPNVKVPGWAYLDVIAEDNFDQLNALDHANGTESTALPTPTSTSTTQTSATSVPVETTTSSTSSSTSFTSSLLFTSASSEPTVSAGALGSQITTHANLVGGTVVGCMIGAGVIATFSWIFLSSRRKKLRGGDDRSSPSDSRILPAMAELQDTPGSSPSRLDFIVPTSTGASPAEHRLEGHRSQPVQDSISDPHFRV